MHCSEVIYLSGKHDNVHTNAVILCIEAGCQDRFSIDVKRRVLYERQDADRVSDWIPSTLSAKGRGGRRFSEKISRAYTANLFRYGILFTGK